MNFYHMKAYTKLVCMLAMGCAIAAGTATSAYSTEKDNPERKEAGMTAVRTAEVPKKMVFAGQTVDFSREDFYERMDREIVAFTFMHTNSVLALKRSGIYFPVVEPILKEMGLPDDLKYLMVIESNLDPTAKSSAGAAGLWQLMTATARSQGLEVNSNIDERYHIEKATRAACKLLKSYYEEYGDWLTVAAAYNAGKNGIDRRLAEQRQASAADLWMTEETMRYMFRMMAAKMMFENPQAFGFDVPEKSRYSRKPPRETVTVTSTVKDLVDFAGQHGVSYAQLKRANLWLRESSLQDESGRTYRVVIPAE